MKRFDGAETIRQAIPDILYDESRFESGTPATIVFPETAEDLRNVVTEAAAQNRPITFIGAQTGTTGGAVPTEGCCAIAFSAMKRIHSVTMDTADHPIVTCDPGITLQEIERFLAAPKEWPDPVPGSDLLTPGTWMYPPDPTEMTAQLGGTVATNASGARSYRYGPTRDHIAFIDVIFTDGTTATLYRPTAGSDWDRSIATDQGSIITVPEVPYKSLPIKNAAGYFNTSSMSAADLIIGSEGTLCALAGIGICLQRKPELLAGLTFFTAYEAAFDFAVFLRKAPNVAAIEFFDEGSLRFIDKYRSRLPEAIPLFPDGSTCALLWEYIEETPGSFENIMEQWEAALIACGSSFDTTWSGFDEKEKERLHHFRHALPETVNSVIAENKKNCKEIRKIGTDSAFPEAVFRTAFDETMHMLKDAGLTFAAFGHLGNHHLHINLIPSTKVELTAALELYGRLMALAIANGGTVSAEHGIGKIKTKYLLAMYGEEGIAGMRRVKAAFDPQGLLNPGNLF